MQLEINSFAYNDKGKPEAQTGQHDDMLIALALALVARSQSKPAEQLEYTSRPKTVNQRLEFYLRHGRNVSEDDQFDDDPLYEHAFLETIQP